MKRLLFMLCTLSASCVGPKLPSLHDLQNSGESIQQQKPQPCAHPRAKLKQHLLLNIRGRSFELSGYLVLLKPERYYAVAYAEAPAPIFAFRYDRGTKHVYAAPEQLPPRIMTEAVMEDLTWAYLNTSERRWISRTSPSGETWWRFGAGKQLQTKITFSHYRQIDGCAIPDLMMLENYEYPYTLEVKLLDYSTNVSDETIHKAFD